MLFFHLSDSFLPPLAPSHSLNEGNLFSISKSLDRNSYMTQNFSPPSSN